MRHLMFGQHLDTLFRTPPNLDYISKQTKFERAVWKENCLAFSEEVQENAFDCTLLKEIRTGVINYEGSLVMQYL